MSLGGLAETSAQSVLRVAAEHADAVDRTSAFPDETLLALRSERLMSALIPTAQRGAGYRLSSVASLCHALGRACGTSAMIYAMHQIEVACIIAHGLPADWHESLLRTISDDQLLLGSATSEVGTGGNILASLCAVETHAGRTQLAKDAPSISYGAKADGLLITARRNATAAPNDQVMVVALRNDYRLQRTSVWDALGMRGTCTEGFQLQFSGSDQQVLPASFADIAQQTMLPVSHLLWGSVWLGIATDAVDRARRYLRQNIRGHGNRSIRTHRLARAVSRLQLVQARLSQALRDYNNVFADPTARLPLTFTGDMNNLKVTASEACLDAVQHAFIACGIAAYRNGTEFSLGRHLRDLMSAPIMVNNDSILEHTGNLLLMQKLDLGIR